MIHLRTLLVTGIFGINIIKVPILLIFREFIFMWHFICTGILSISSTRSECNSNNDCASSLACVDRTCVSPCGKLLCGKNAYCEPENHAAWCRCKVGFTEGPDGQCVSREYMFNW